MTTSKSGAIASAWDSGMDFRTPPRPSDHTSKIHRPRRAVDVRRSPAATLPRTRRGSPPPLEDDIDVLGGLLFVLLFLVTVWL